MSLDHRKFLAGDPATTQLFLQAADRWVRRSFTDPVQRESVVQAAMAEMIEKLRAGKTPAHERTLYWIYACANNAVRRKQTYVRNQKGEVAYESQLHGQALIDLSRALRLRGEIDDVRELLENSDQKIREILEARARGFTYSEIAEHFQVTEGAARDSVARLRKRLVDDLTARDKVEYLLQQAKRFGLVRHPSTPAATPTESEAKR